MVTASIPWCYKMILASIWSYQNWSLGILAAHSITDFYLRVSNTSSQCEHAQHTGVFSGASCQHHLSGFVPVFSEPPVNLCTCFTTRPASTVLKLPSPGVLLQRSFRPCWGLGGGTCPWWCRQRRSLAADDLCPPWLGAWWRMKTADMDDEGFKINIVQTVKENQTWADVSHLFQWNLFIAVEVHGGKQRVRTVAQPHKHVALRDAFLQLHQLQLKEKHGAPRDSVSCTSRTEDMSCVSISWELLCCAHLLANPGSDVFIAPS